MNRRTIICFGDSITQCQGMAENHRWPSKLAFLLERNFPDRFDVYNKGIGGNTTSLALDRIREEVIPLLPATVIIEFGINDCYVYPWSKMPRVGLSDFRNNLAEIIRQLESPSGRPLLIINHPLTQKTDFHPQGNERSIESNLSAYNAALKEIAEAKQLPFLDIPVILKQRGIPPSDLHGEDGVHLSDQGNRIYAELVYERLVTQ